MAIEYLCISCGRSFVKYNSLQRKCGVCQYNSFKPRKPIKRIGKVTQKWIDTRKQWLQDNPPAHNGKWRCELNISPQCLVWVDIDQLQLDHIQARSKRPDLRFDLDNLQASCSPCNLLKGSRLLQ